MKFLEKIVQNLLDKNPDLSGFTIVLPGKRPVVFFKKILAQQQYQGFLPNFITIEDLITEISGLQCVQGISLWLFAYDCYQQSSVTPKDDFNSFLKWFPTILKDWDDMLKFSDDEEQVISYLFDEERIKNWSQGLLHPEDYENQEVPRVKFLNFWKNMSVFLPHLKNKLLEKGWGTSGMIHKKSRHQISRFAENTTHQFIFCGFNAFTPVEELLVRSLLQLDKAETYFQADQYYINDQRQEAGKFLRKHLTWKEFNENRTFNWVEDAFSEDKNIKLYEVSGNISQTKILPEILAEINSIDQDDFSNTAIVLLDENLLPASLDALSSVPYLNITMGFPLKNLSFSNAMKHLFQLQKQLAKKDSTYYYNDILPILEELPKQNDEQEIVSKFRSLLHEKNIVYVRKSLILEELSGLSFINLLLKPESELKFLEDLIQYCTDIKSNDLDDVLYENISYFEQSFRKLYHHLEQFNGALTIDTLEVLVNQMIATETIDFEGEPLQGLQVMGLLETRLLNFKNIILLSVNEGKLPLGNSQNTYIPFDVRQHFGLHTYLENDSIYAYHFYRLLQNSENVYLLFNALSSGVNIGEKSRFVTQLEFEDQHHTIEKFIIENTSHPVIIEPMTVNKTSKVLEQLEVWKNRVSATHLTSYIYNPIDFYLHKILETNQFNEIEEELSSKNYGTLVHKSLEFLYKKIIGKQLIESDLCFSPEVIQESLNFAINELNHQPEYYERGMNYIHRSMAERVVLKILEFDRTLLAKGHQLKIIALEQKFENITLPYDDSGNEVKLFGYIDRIDELDGVIRIIDYKTAKTKELKLTIKEENVEDYLIRESKSQALQLCMYLYVAQQLKEFKNHSIITGIWSFAEVNKGLVPLQFAKGSLDEALISVKNLIQEILNPTVTFSEKIT